jgi:hypothetical protein
MFDLIIHQSGVSAKDDLWLSFAFYICSASPQCLTALLE